MQSYIVRQQRPHWVTFAQLVTAETAEDAVRAFDPASPETAQVVENIVTGVKPGPAIPFSEDNRWAEAFPIEDWMEEVANRDTTMGYREWLAIRSEILEED